MTQLHVIPKIKNKQDYTHQ